LQVFKFEIDIQLEKAEFKLVVNLPKNEVERIKYVHIQNGKINIICISCREICHEGCGLMA
jgi:hypothetical protein